MEIKAQDIRDTMLKLQGQMELLNGMLNQALEQEKKVADESVKKD